MALRTDGNHRYSCTKNKRSPFVSYTRPRALPLQHDQLMSEHSSLQVEDFDLNGEASSVNKKHGSATIVADVKRFSHQINTDEFFDTHMFRQATRSRISRASRPLHRLPASRSSNGSFSFDNFDLKSTRILLSQFEPQPSKSVVTTG